MRELCVLCWTERGFDGIERSEGRTRSLSKGLWLISNSFDGCKGKEISSVRLSLGLWGVYCVLARRSGEKAQSLLLIITRPLSLSINSQTCLLWRLVFFLWHFHLDCIERTSFTKLGLEWKLDVLSVRYCVTRRGKRGTDEIENEKTGIIRLSEISKEGIELHSPQRKDSTRRILIETR